MSAFTRPIHVCPDGIGSPLTRVSLGGNDDKYSERWLQNILFAHPQTLPIAEIAPHASTLVPVCMELETGAGSADILYVTRTGQLVMVETKLWRNPQARREVVAQILDYAKELAEWSYEDLARETARASGNGPDYLLACVHARYPDLDEAAFVDGINRSLSSGDFILIIAGDGIRSGAEALVSFLDRFGHLRFQFALVEVATYRLADDSLLLQPRVLAKTELLRRTVFMPAHGGDLTSSHDEAHDTPAQAARIATQEASANSWEQFWRDYLNGLVLDDTQQAPPAQPPRGKIIYLQLPPGGNHVVWITAYVAQAGCRAGVFLTLGRNLAQAGEWYERLCEQHDMIEAVVPGLVWQGPVGKGAYRLDAPSIQVTTIDEPAQRAAVLLHLQEQTNRMVNAFRHRLDQMSKKSGAD
jgi:hypothetical protein